MGFYGVNRLKQFYKNLPIKKKLLLVFYIQIMIPLVFMGVMFYQKSAETIQNKSVAYSHDLLKMIQLRVEDFVGGVTKLSQDVLYEKLVYDVLDNEDLYEDRSIYYGKIIEMKEYLRKITLSNRAVMDSICLVTTGGNMYAYDADSRFSIRREIPYNDILKQAREAKGKPIWYLHVKEDKVEKIYLARLISSKSTYQEIGLLIIQVKQDFLSTAYEGLSDEGLENIAFISEENWMITSRKEDNIKFLGIFFDRGLEEGRGSYIDKRSQMLVSYTTIQNPNWRIVANISLQALHKEIDSFRVWSILLMVCTLLIFSVLSIMTAVDIAEPIHKLVEGMKNMGEGKEGNRISVDRSDELGFLAQNFNQMSDQIHHLVRVIYQEQLTLKEAEIKALQAQINPHFLYNTLESINWMAQLNGVPEISNMISALSSLTEANIGRDGRLISLKEELAYIDHYIFILKNRYGDRLQMERNIELGVLDHRIPRLLIQPLVENAVYHGVDKSRKSVLIQLDVRKREDHIHIEVKDHGVGMRSEEVEAFNRKFTENINSYFMNMKNVKNRSIGLENVNTRIKLFYGEEYSLRMESEYGKYTKVVIKIPIELKEDRRTDYVEGINC